MAVAAATNVFSTLVTQCAPISTAGFSALSLHFEVTGDKMTGNKVTRGQNDWETK
jgi:hypothetical protein